MSFELSKLEEHNSALLELLTKNLPDMLWVKDINGKYIYANKAICDGLLKAKDTDEPIGKDDVFFALREREAHKEDKNWHTFGELCFDSDKSVIDKNKAMRFEEYGNVNGKLLYLEVYKAPFYDDNGNIVGTVGTGRDITNLKMAQFSLEESLQKLEYQANYDFLTALPNRNLLLDRLTQSINNAQRSNEKVAILLIDLDHFKEINDSLGHNMGDKILVDFSKRLSSKVRKSDTLSRLGGDEFCIILNNIKDRDSVLTFISKITELTKKPFEIDEHILYVNISIGISMYSEDGEDANHLLKNADAALYKSKNDGRNTYCFYDQQMTQKAMDRVFLETSLRKALKDDQLVVFFQPQFDSRHDKIVGMEALVRWEHPTLGIIPPNDFIPLAELTGMIVQLDRIVMRKALLQYAKWQKAYLYNGKISLNVTINQLEDDTFLGFVKNLLNELDCEIKNIEFEVTETQLMRNPEKSIKILNELNDLGIAISIDDFGTGYSSLAYLKKLPISKLKIDRSFVKDIPSDSDDVAITKTIINLCESLNLKVIAEGVETLDQKRFFIENGCKFIQGYFYSKPVSSSQMEELLKQNFN